MKVKCIVSKHPTMLGADTCPDHTDAFISGRPMGLEPYWGVSVPVALGRNTSHPHITRLHDPHKASAPWMSVNPIP